MHRARVLTTAVAAVALLLTGVVAGFAAGGTGTVTPPPSVAFLATGTVAADSLAAGPMAGRLDAPVFTTHPAQLSEPASAGIAALDPQLVIVLGGPGAINDEVVAALSTAIGKPVLEPDEISPDADGIVRVFGVDRYETAGEIAELFALFSPGFLPVDATALGALDADHATTADTAMTAENAMTAATADHAATADSVSNQVPFSHLMSFGDTVTIAENGPISLSVTCDQDGGNDRLRFHAATTEDGALLLSFAGALLDGSSPADFLDTDTPEGNREFRSWTVATGTAQSTYVIDHGSIVGPSGEAILIDGETNSMGFNLLGADCFTVGLATLVPAPTDG